LPSARRVAVLLNRRAQGVTAAREAWFRANVPAEDLFVTETIEAGRAAIRAVVERGYDVACPGGGDGTFMFTAAELLAIDPPPARLPALLALRLGTGNAVHDVCGSAPPTPAGLAADLARARDPAHPASPLRLLLVDGTRLAQFAGVGLDADWQADYADVVKRRIGTSRLMPLLRGVPGYVATAVSRTIPRLVVQPPLQVRVVAVAGGARLDAAGATVAAVAAGEDLYTGPATMVAASTVPSYSAGMRFFPDVDRIGEAFELKVTLGGAVAVVRHFAKVLRGEHVPGHVFAFAAREVRIEVSPAARYHVGGDVMPATSALRVGIHPRTVPVVRGRAPAAP
jgi:diacylglycerol kinase family enzyme